MTVLPRGSKSSPARSQGFPSDFPRVTQRPGVEVRNFKNLRKGMTRASLSPWSLCLGPEIEQLMLLGLVSFHCVCPTQHVEAIRSMSPSYRTIMPRLHLGPSWPLIRRLGQLLESVLESSFPARTFVDPYNGYTWGLFHGGGFDLCPMPVS